MFRSVDPARSVIAVPGPDPAIEPAIHGPADDGKENDST
jgi:hypothetical protein